MIDLSKDAEFKGHIEKLKAGQESKINPRLSILLDVATKYTGYAVFEGGRVVPPTASLVQYGLIKGGSGEWEVRCLEITSKLSHLIRAVKPGLCVLEYPTFQAGSKGMAASRSGGTLELAYLCGRWSVVWEYYIAKVLADTQICFHPAYLVSFRDWAGQVSKEITCHRCEEHFGLHIENPSSIENNFVDAIMMGKKFLGEKFNVLKGCEGSKREDY